jgi:integrase/recombinase XerD
MSGREDVDLSNGCVKVTGKGDKERVVYFGKRTTRAIWKYIVPRLTGDDEEHADEYLFAVGEQEGNPRKMRRRILTNMLQRLGDRAGVPNTYTHRFRHTFAINYLRNDGDLLTLQALLGHSDLTMVRRYARIAQMDCKRVHKKAGPVDNWKL